MKIRQQLVVVKTLLYMRDKRVASRAISVQILYDLIASSKTKIAFCLILAMYHNCILLKEDIIGLRE